MFQALLMLDKEIFDKDLPCITKSKNINLEQCHVYSFNTKSLDSLKVDDVEVFKKSECYTALLIIGKKHEKYVNKGNNNICTGNSDHHELKIVNITLIISSKSSNSSQSIYIFRISVDQHFLVIVYHPTVSQFLKDS